MDVVTLVVSTTQGHNLGLVAHHCYFTHVPCASDAIGPEAGCKILNAKRTLKQVCLAMAEAHTHLAQSPMI